MYSRVSSRPLRVALRELFAAAVQRVIRAECDDPVAADVEFLVAGLGG